MKNSGEDGQDEVDNCEDGSEAKEDHVQVQFKPDVTFVGIAQVKLLAFC